MKALTIHQPYAWLILDGEKTVENRQWSSDYRGPLAIHAGSKQQALRQGCLSKIPIFRSQGYPIPDDLTFGAIVGVVDLVDIVRFDPAQRRLPTLIGSYDLEHDPFACGAYCWILANPRSLAAPIRCHGRPGLWNAEIPGFEA